MNSLTQNCVFSEDDMRSFEPVMKIGLVASINPQGQPHITLLSSLMASSPTTVVWGQFAEGIMFDFVARNPKIGFLVMSLNKELWRGKASYTHSVHSGPEYDAYNNTPMFRYNAYFGIHTVYYAELVGQTGKSSLPMNSIVFAAVQTLAARTLAGGKSRKVVLNPWTRRLMDKVGNLKFLAYIQDDGYPAIIPVIQAATLDSEHVLMAASAYGDELSAIPAGAPAAVFGMELNMTDVLLRGEFTGMRRVSGVRCGVVRVDWVYNPMPPKPQQIYPATHLEAIKDFE